MIGRVGFSCDILFSVSSHVSNIITTHKPAASLHSFWLTIYPLAGIAWPFLFHSYLGLLINSHACNRSSSQLYWSWSLLSWSVIGIARSHACIKCEVMPFFSVHNKHREEKGKIFRLCAYQLDDYIQTMLVGHAYRHET
jgi:hypothetical protein